MTRIAIFASGTGSNFEAITLACHQGIIAAEVVLLVCDNSDAEVIERAHKLGVACFVFNPKLYGSKQLYETRIVEELHHWQVDLICLAGYMRIVSSTLLEAFKGAILNIHPSLLPSFKGRQAIAQALSYGVKVFGATVHWVDASIDGGEIVGQRAFTYEGTDLSEVESLMHATEHILYVETIQKLINKRDK